MLLRNIVWPEGKRRGFDWRNSGHVNNNRFTNSCSGDCVRANVTNKLFRHSTCADAVQNLRIFLSIRSIYTRYYSDLFNIQL